MSAEKKFVLQGACIEDVEAKLTNLRATIERQAAEMQAREASYMDALAAKSIRIDELATLIESLQTEIERLRAGAMPEEVQETLLDGIAIIEEQTNDGHPLEDTERARRWLESQPTATDKAVCPKCGGENCQVSPQGDEMFCHRCSRYFVISPPREVNHG